jgi:F-type H+-transporting ATPase subunit b
MGIGPLAGALLLSGGLTDVNFVLTAATVVLFALFAFVLGRFGWKPLLSMIEEREKSVREAVESAERANAEAQALLLKHHELVREAGQKRDEALKRALQDAEHLKADIVQAAQAERDRVVRQAREQIEREKGQAILDLRAQVADIAIEAASKIVASSLTPDAQRKLVSDFIETLPKVH